ncbi:MAG: tetratricopeptide repeat protein [Thiohalomonadaceae bacterium]
MLALLTALSAGCASQPPRQAGSTDAVSSEASGYAIREEANLDSRLQADFDRAVEHLRAGEHTQGIALLTAITAHPKGQHNTAPYINLAIAYQRIDQLEQAEKALQQALEINPDHPAANNEYGMVLRRSGRFDAARATYERVLDKYPDYLPARKNLGILCDLFLGDLDCALEHYRIYSEAVPEDAVVTLWIADLQNRRGMQ